MFDTDTRLTSRFGRALELARTLYARDVRKGASVPYLAHLLGVCSLVLVDNGDEDEAIAALLHDALEDHPEAIDARRIEERFGARARAESLKRALTRRLNTMAARSRRGDSERARTSRSCVPRRRRTYGWR